MTDGTENQPAQRSPAEKTPPAGAGAAAGFNADGNGLGQRFRDLNAIVLSIEWEISDETMSRFVREVEQLKQESQGDKIIFSCLQLLTSAGVYVKNKKASAHPASINLLHSVHQVLSRMIAHPNLSTVEKRKMVAVEVKKFKALQAELIRSKTNGRTAGPAAQGTRAAPAPGPSKGKAEITGASKPAAEIRTPPPTSMKKDAEGTAANGAAASVDVLLAQAVEDIKQLVRTEMESLRQELRNWHAHS